MNGNRQHGIQISHSVCTEVVVFPAHKMALKYWVKQDRAIQKIYQIAPTFHDSNCQYSGTSEAANPRTAKMEKKGTVECIMLGWIQGWRMKVVEGSKPKQKARRRRISRWH